MTSALEQTGTPIFVMVTTETLPAQPIWLQDTARLRELIPAETHLVDRLLHLSVKGFFQMGGQSLVVLPISIDGSASDLNSVYLQAILGRDEGYLRRTGYHALKNYNGLADLVVFPQAPIVLSAPELTYLYCDVLTTFETFLPKFLLMDTPCYSSPAKAISWSQSLTSALGAVFYPWVSVADVGFLPVSILVAATLQNIDRRFGIAEPMANRTLPKRIEPLTALTPLQVRQLTAARVNCLRQLADQTLAFWGTYTLSRQSDHTDFIHSVRALRALQDALEETCEPFLMEARTAVTCQRLETAVVELLERAQELGILAASSSDGQKSFSVECALTNDRPAGEPTLTVHADIALERADRRVGLSLAL